MMPLSTTVSTALQQVIRRIPDLSRCVDVDFTTPMMVDGDSLTYRGILRGRCVIVKRHRFILPTADNQVDAEALHDASIWSLLDHVNIHSFLGVIRTVDEAIFTVAEWIENGNAHDYVRNHSIDPSNLLLGTARALAYLHSRGIFHGYKNVLVSGDGGALLTAFCYSSLLDMTVSHPVVGSVRWMAPEGISDGIQPKPSAEMDVWAFGMIVLELFTRALPFEDEKSDRSIMLRVVRGVLPGRPSCMTDEWWTLCTSCWNMEPALRPNMSTIVDVIEGITSLLY
ncbi:hypothetical protein ID866_7773 [Astraeus odoratus]|nr:hypothetical protein ID866_7773 [Astraeus odoratus]